MIDLLYRIATLLSFLLIGIGSLIQNNVKELAITTLIQSIITILSLIVSCIIAIIIIYFYRQKKDDIIFKFNKKNKTLKIINNSAHNICVYDVLNKKNTPKRDNLMVPSKTDFTIYNIEFSIKTAKYSTIEYRYIININNDIYQNSLMYYRLKI